MNKHIKFLTLALIMVFAYNANAQRGVATVSTTIDATATIITPITVIGTNLAFGKIATSGVGTVTITPTGALSSTGDARHGMGTTGDSGTAGSIVVSGEENESFSIKIEENSALALNGTGTVDAETMTLSKFTSSLGIPDGGNTDSVSTYAAIDIGAAATTVTIGATLSTKATQTKGDYTGSIKILISYE